MNWSDSLRLRITSELKGYDVYFSADDVPLEVDFPKQWLGFGFLDSEKNIFLWSGLIFLSFCLG